MPTSRKTPCNLDKSANPAQAPATSHQNHADARSPNKALAMLQAPASRAASSGPSGRTQLPLVQAITGARLSVVAAQKAARSANRRAVKANISQVLNANSRMKGKRRANAA